MKTFIAIALGLGLGVAGCGGSDTAGLEPEYTGCGTDENWRTFDDQERLVKPADDDNAPLLTAPAAGTAITFAAPPVWSWQPDAGDPGTAAGNVPHDGPGCNNCCPQYNTGGLITPAHEPPISGDVYDLHFTVDGTEVWRVVTTFQEWTPNLADATAAAAWAKMRGKTVSLRVWRMSVLRNDVKAGPFAAATPSTFTVGN